MRMQCDNTLWIYSSENEKERVKRVLFVPTGALLSTVSFNEGNSIPGIAHAVMLEGISGSGKGVGEWTM